MEQTHLIKKLANTIFMMVTVGALSACGTYAERPIVTSPQFKELDYVFAPDPSDMLTMDERISLQKALAPIPADSLKTATILTSQPAMANSAKLHDLQVFLTDNGFEPEDTKLVVTADASPLSIHVRYKIFVLPEKCPNWHATGTFNQEDSLASHFGCANVLNLSSMVADPSDLVKGKKSARTDTETAVQAIQHYYAGTPATSATDATESTSTSETTGTGGN